MVGPLKSGRPKISLFFPRLPPLHFVLFLSLWVSSRVASFCPLLDLALLLVWLPTRARGLSGVLGRREVCFGECCNTHLPRSMRQGHQKRCGISFGAQRSDVTWVGRCCRWFATVRTQLVVDTTVWSARRGAVHIDGVALTVVRRCGDFKDVRFHPILNFGPFLGRPLEDVRLGQSYHFGSEALLARSFFHLWPKPLFNPDHFLAQTTFGPCHVGPDLGPPMAQHGDKKQAPKGGCFGVEAPWGHWGPEGCIPGGRVDSGWKGGAPKG